MIDDIWWFWGKKPIIGTIQIVFEPHPESCTVVSGQATWNPDLDSVVLCPAWASKAFPQPAEMGKGSRLWVRSKRRQYGHSRNPRIYRTLKGRGNLLPLVGDLKNHVHLGYLQNGKRQLPMMPSHSLVNSCSTESFYRNVSCMADLFFLTSCSTESQDWAVLCLADLLGAFLIHLRFEFLKSFMLDSSLSNITVEAWHKESTP